MLCDGEVDCELVDDEMHRDEGGFCENIGRRFPLGGPVRFGGPGPIRTSLIGDDDVLTVVPGVGEDAQGDDQ